MVSRTRRLHLILLAVSSVALISEFPIPIAAAAEHEEPRGGNLRPSGKRLRRRSHGSRLANPVEVIIRQRLIRPEGPANATTSPAVHENSGTSAAAASCIAPQTASISCASVDIVPTETRTIQCPAAVAGVT